jgi:hypothetical protein
MVVTLIGLPYEQTEEYIQKQAILNERATRFKAETGFEGDITYNYQYMTFSNIIGNFRDIVVTAPQDTVYMKQVFDRVLAKVKPYISAQEGQLFKGKTLSNIIGSRVSYEQIVNGYRIEGGFGYLKMSYNFTTCKLSIVDDTADISSDIIPINITLKQAVKLSQDEVYNGADVIPCNHRIAYTLGDNDGGKEFYLCYVLNFEDYTINVDVSNLTIRSRTPSIFVRSFDVSVIGDVYNEAYTDTTHFQLTQKAMGGVLLKTPIDSLFANQFGNQTISDSTYTWLEAELNDRDIFRVVVHPNVMTVQHDSVNVSGNQLTAYFHDNYAKTANAYWHSHDQQQFIDNLVVDEIYQPWRLKVVTDYPYTSGGTFHPSLNEIRISTNAGKLSHVVRHELSHSNVFSVLGGTLFNPTNNDSMSAMDEAFAVYLPCAAIESPYCIYGNPQDPQRIDVLNHINTVTSLSLNEITYEDYDVRHTISSAWWEIRNRLGDTYFNQFLVYALINNVLPTEPLRYKPRYFYNILMRNSTTSNQLVIDKAYSDRGLHFTPQVISAGVSNPPNGRDKNMFRIGDPVHVKVTNCPQNTPLTVYIVEDQDYTDGMNISALNAIICQVSGTSDNDGVWYSSTPVMTASDVGDYDILVDIGNNGVLHFAYNGANVRDGFDGLNGPGFSVFDDGINVVLALDLSQSMVGECANLQQLTRRFISAMLPGDKINIFGFNEGIPPYWNGGFTNLSPTPAAQLYSITLSNQNSFINNVGLPSAGGNTDLLVPFKNGYSRFGTLTERKKGMVLLSDGEHHPTIDPEHQNNPHYTNPHRMYDVRNSIYSYYNPRDIECYTMRFGNISSGIVNMNNIAYWGHGVAYQVPQLSNMSLIVSRLINRLRGNPPSYENNHSIPPNSTQTLQIVVDDLADKLRTTLIWNTIYNHSDNLLFTLTSPSGIIYNQPECLGSTTQKYIIDAPESGIWYASIANNYSSTLTYSLISEVDSDLTVSVEEIPIMYPVDCPLLLQVSVFDYNTPISNAGVSALLERGEWQFSVDLYDDGSHNDGNAGDGLYGNYLYAYAAIVNDFPYYQQYGNFGLSIIVDIPSINGRRVVNQNLYLSYIQPSPYPQVTRNIHKGWNWVGYPRLQRDEVGTSIDYANASLCPFLTDIISSDGIAQYRNNQWNYYGLSYLRSEPGYKLRINDTTSVRLFELGTIIDTLMVHQLREGQWNWVTYPCYEMVYPWEALSGVIDRIDYIMAEDWSMKKDGDEWIYDGFSRPHLKYGDSIMIRTVRDCEFVWNNRLTKPIIVDPRKPSYFKYEEKPNYETIMIASIEGNPEFTEIGVFQDDVCIGARVNEAYPIQILAYSTPEDEGGGALSFMLYSESKGTISASPATIQPGNYIANEPTIEPELYGFRVLTLKTNNQPMPSVLALHSNYPNPFNPSTTINFSLPKTAPVRLFIYNIRGQKVKDLLNESLECGNHSVVWNGQDDGNCPVASGVYFARLEQGGVTIISKMMLIK